MKNAARKPPLHDYSRRRGREEGRERERRGKEMNTGEVTSKFRVSRKDFPRRENFA